MLKFRGIDFLQSVSHVGRKGLREVGHHPDRAWQGGLVTRISAQHRQDVIRLRVMHNGPFRIFVQDTKHRRQQSWAAVLTEFSKDLRVMKHDPATDLVGIPLKLVLQLVRRMSRVEFDDRVRLARKLAKFIAMLIDVGRSTASLLKHVFQRHSLASLCLRIFVETVDIVATQAIQWQTQLLMTWAAVADLAFHTATIRAAGSRNGDPSESEPDRLR